MVIIEFHSPRVWKLGAQERGKSPVFLVLSPLGNPSLEDFLLLIRERFICRGRGHDQVWVMRLDSLEQLACLGVPWQVESQIGLSAFVIESVASKAVVGQNRPNFFLKINPMG
jgi:hypothetical protein